MTSSRSIIIVLTLVLLTNGCAHKVDTPAPYDEMGETQISVIQSWTAKGKLLVTAQNTRQSLRFTWRHQVEGEDVITLSDTLGIKALVLHQRDGVLYERQPDQSLSKLQTHQLKKDLRAFTSMASQDFARALTGEALPASDISSEVRSWQSVGGLDAPKTILLRGADIAVKVVVSHWELENNAK